MLVGALFSGLLSLWIPIWLLSMSNQHYKFLHCFFQEQEEHVVEQEVVDHDIKEEVEEHEDTMSIIKLE